MPNCMSVSSYRNGPWRCGGPICPGDSTCKAAQRNAAEAERLRVLRADRERPERLWEAAWAAACGIPADPPPTITDARASLRWWEEI